MIDLRPEQLEEVKRILLKHVPDCEIRVFGSRVRGTARPFSDLDLAIAGKAKIPEKSLEDLKDAFAESNLPIKVDLLDWHDISEKFQNVIEKQYEVLS